MVGDKVILWPVYSRHLPSDNIGEAVIFFWAEGAAAQYYGSPVKIAWCKGIQVSRIPGTGYQSLSVELGFWIPIVHGILDSLSCIPDAIELKK